MKQLNLACYSAPYRSVLRQFQRFVARRLPKRAFSEAALRAWLKDGLKASPLTLVVHRSHLVNRFLDWLAARGSIAANPIAELRCKYECRSSAAVLRALAGAQPIKALESLRPPPRYGSHLGKIMREHVNRMRIRGLRYRHENRFLQFDRFLQQRPGADQEPLTTLIREYAACVSSAAGKVQRIQLGRVIAKELNRSGLAVAAPKRDRLLVQEMLRGRRQPHVYTVEEVRRLLEVARRDPAPRAPLRSHTLYMMLVLAYCAGLRLGEIVDLKLGDLDLNTDCIEVRDTKFFKSRRLPLSATAMTALRDYLKARVKADAPTESDAPLFWHAKGGYGYVAAGAHLRRLIRAAGLRKTTGRTGPRVHDLRHAFVVHRMTMWYEQGINPQTRLPYLAAYLGHRNIHSTLVYLTITQELLQHANERFRTSEAEVLQVIQRSH
ncbi:MAG TPA: tyrosine-type recombinase/integrase [Bryobacteraceae bacterium]|nr:tyrosine-type recombinase/integrase [Bryobacteraceae bacterium]